MKTLNLTPDALLFDLGHSLLFDLGHALYTPEDEDEQ